MPDSVDTDSAGLDARLESIELSRVSRRFSTCWNKLLDSLWNFQSNNYCEKQHLQPPSDSEQLSCFMEMRLRLSFLPLFRDSHLSNTAKITTIMYPLASVKQDIIYQQQQLLFFSLPIGVISLIDIGSQKHPAAVYLQCAQKESFTFHQARTGFSASCYLKPVTKREGINLFFLSLTLILTCLRRK